MTRPKRRGPPRSRHRTCRGPAEIVGAGGRGQGQVEIPGSPSTSGQPGWLLRCVIARRAVPISYESVRFPPTYRGGTLHMSVEESDSRLKGLPVIDLGVSGEHGRGARVSKSSTCARSRSVSTTGDKGFQRHTVQCLTGPQGLTPSAGTGLATVKDERPRPVEPPTHHKGWVGTGRRANEPGRKQCLVSPLR